MAAAQSADDDKAEALRPSLNRFVKEFMVFISSTVCRRNKGGQAVKCFGVALLAVALSKHENDALVQREVLDETQHNARGEQTSRKQVTNESTY